MLPDKLGSPSARKGQVNCFKRKARIVFGRANFDVVRLRVLRRAYPSFPDARKAHFVLQPQWCIRSLWYS